MRESRSTAYAQKRICPEFETMQTVQKRIDSTKFLPNNEKINFRQFSITARKTVNLTRKFCTAYIIIIMAQLSDRHNMFGDVGGLGTRGG